MNYKKAEKAWALRGISPHYKIVLLNLIFRENKKGECWPSLPTIVADTKVSRKMVIEALQHFEDVGILVKRKRYGKSPVYTTFPEPDSSVENATNGENAISVENDTHSSGENGTSILYTELSNELERRPARAHARETEPQKKAAAVLYRGIEFAKIRQAADELIRTIPAFSSLQGNDQRIAELLMPVRRSNTQNANSLLNQAVDYASGKHSTQRAQHETNRRANGKMLAYLESIGATPDRLTAEAWREWNNSH